MELKTNFISRSTGRRVDVWYKEVEDSKEISHLDIYAVGAICFYGEKMVIVYSDKKGAWSPPGGGVEKGENFVEATIREVKEETNMKVLKQKLIAIQIVTEPGVREIVQTVSVCVVEPYGPFVADMEEGGQGDVTKIELIDPLDYKKYFDWGANIDRTIVRALEVIKELR